MSRDQGSAQGGRSHLHASEGSTLAKSEPVPKFWIRDQYSKWVATVDRALEILKAKKEYNAVPLPVREKNCCVTSELTEDRGRCDSVWMYQSKFSRKIIACLELKARGILSKKEFDSVELPVTKEKDTL
ncbi:hypothetical protein M501DRAFT_989687 [Patellaria atrata CBS 101060]|uniref:Uncharacterized protein n=1 Tax=Patellaria atrata CBS 101060 TaxID=1346257 RepID=A0A9P4SE72_9PEZI|nr:hypothetical protein M501DRAFT_989687 [Patellaria atrata CBS 101060]